MGRKKKQKEEVEEHILTKQERDELKDIRLASWLDRNYPEIMDEFEHEGEEAGGILLYT